MIVPLKPAHLAPLCDFWNETFADRRHFTPMTPSRWRERIGTERLLVAIAGRHVVGMIHVGEWGEAACRRRFPGWPRGRMGVVMMLGVLPSARRQGIGTRLWHAGRDAIAGVEQVTLSPGVYGGTPPLWGTPTGPAVTWSDSRTRKFLGERGCAPRAKAVTMEIALPAALPAMRVKTVEVAPGVRAIVGKGRTPLRSVEARRIEVLTYPEIDSRGHARFERAGFVKVADWALYNHGR